MTEPDQNGNAKRTVNKR